MKEILNTVVKIIGWLILLSAFASIGFATDNPQVMVPVYFLIFLVIFGLVLLYNVKRQKRTEVNPVIRDTFNKILGLILVLASILVPYFFFRGVGFSGAVYFILILLTAVLIGVAIIAIRLINREGFTFNLIGYLLLLLLCSVPALVMMQHDRSYHALGLAYYAALAISVLAWAGINTLGKYVKI